MTLVVKGLNQRISTTRKATAFAKYVLPHPKKLINYVGLKISILIGRPDTGFYPVKLGMETANICNLVCPLCVRAREKLKRPPGVMEYEDYQRVIDTLGDYLIHVRLHGWGEPFLNKDLLRMAEYAHKRGIYTNFHTNGHFLTDENINKMIDSGLDEVTVAMDGMSQETYSAYRVGGDFNKVKEGVERLCRIKRERKAKNPYVNLQFLMMSHNEHEIPKVIEYAEKIGVDQLLLKTLNIVLVEEDSAKQFLPKDDENTRYDRDGDTIKFKKTSPCTCVTTEVKLNWDGTVTLCTCDDTHGGYVSGNLFKDDIKAVLFSEQYINARRKSLKKSFDMCRKCEGHKSSI